MPFAAVTVLVPFIVWMLASPVLVPTGSISGCVPACPENRFLVASDFSLAMETVRLFRIGIVLSTLATTAIIVWRLVTGTPPRRRAFMIGAPIAVFFLLTAATLRGMLLFEVGDPQVLDILGWIVVVSRAAIW